MVPLISTSDPLCPRLALCRPSSGTLKLGLGLLGILSLERMGGVRGVRGIQAGAFWPSGWNLAQSVLRAYA